MRLVSHYCLYFWAVFGDTSTSRFSHAHLTYLFCHSAMLSSSDAFVGFIYFYSSQMTDTSRSMLPKCCSGRSDTCRNGGECAITTVQSRVLVSSRRFLRPFLSVISFWVSIHWRSRQCSQTWPSILAGECTKQSALTLYGVWSASEICLVLYHKYMGLSRHTLSWRRGFFVPNRCRFF